MPDFIPRRDTTAVAWGANFTRLVVSDYQTFGFSLQDAEQLAALQTQFADAVQAANCASTRTSPVVSGKTAARKDFEQQARWMAKFIRANSAISRATQIELGLVIGPGREARRRRIGRPESAPRIWVLGVSGSRVTIRLRNAEHPGRFGMAPDVQHAIVYACVGDTAPAQVRAWGIIRGTTTTRLTIDVKTPHAPGAKLWLAAQWSNARTETGPVSQPMYTYLGNPSAMPGRMAA